MRVYVHGAGKVGRALAARLRAAGARVTLRSAREGLARGLVRADLVVLAVRDRDLGPLATTMVTHVSRSAVCVHVAGAVGPEVLAPLRAACAGVAQMHPMISFASLRFFPTLDRGNVRVAGDARAVRVAKRVARALGMTPRDLPGLDTIGYHAAAGLVANGAAALAAMGAKLLSQIGVPEKDVPRVLGPLLRSVAENVEALGFPDALTGPVRRGDPEALRKHAAILSTRLPEVLPLYRASVAAQLPLARALGECPPAALDAIQQWLDDEK
jgi:predicted short-subunit dehydrogenase-like oxidoreductase (DUF2520 family)